MCGPPLCTGYGIAAGAGAGAVAGVQFAGQKFDDRLNMANAGKGRGGNRGENAEADRIVKEYGLNREGRRALHDEITKRGMDVEEIEQKAGQLAEQENRLKPLPQP